MKYPSLWREICQFVIRSIPDSQEILKQAAASNISHLNLNPLIKFAFVASAAGRTPIIDWLGLCQGDESDLMAIPIEFEGPRTNSRWLDWIRSTALWQADSLLLMESVVICLRCTRPDCAAPVGATTCFPTVAIAR